MNAIRTIARNHEEKFVATAVIATALTCAVLIRLAELGAM